MSRFQGSSSISSAEYFNRQESTYAASRGMQTPDLDDVKESVRQGVTKVAGRLSNLASGAMSQLQVKLMIYNTPSEASVASFFYVITFSVNRTVLSEWHCVTIINVARFARKKCVSEASLN